jgi:hypothetical protein
VTCRPGTPADSYLCCVANMSANMSATRWPDRHMSVILTLVLTRRHLSLPAKDTSMSLLLLVDILVDYSEMPLSNVVGGVDYVLLVQIYCLAVTIYNGIK